MENDDAESSDGPKTVTNRKKTHNVRLLAETVGFLAISIGFC